MSAQEPATLKKSAERFCKMIPFHSFYPENEPAPYLYTRAFLRVEAGYPYHLQQEPADGYLFLYSSKGKGILTAGKERMEVSGSCIAFLPCSLGCSLKIHSAAWNHIIAWFDGREAGYYYKEALREMKLKLEAQPAAGKRSERDLNGGFGRAGVCIAPVPESSDLPLMLSGAEYGGGSAFSSPWNQIAFSSSLLAEAVKLLASSGETQCVPDYLNRIRQQLDRAYTQPWTLNLLEETFHVNKFKIVRDFTQYYGTAPITYLTRRRIDAAKIMLAANGGRIHEIGRQTGYANVNHFIRAFRKETGMTPGEYRRIHFPVT